MPVQTLPRSAESYAREQRTEIGAAVGAVRRQWRRMGEEFDPSYRVIEPTLLAITGEAQRRIAESAQAYVPRVLADTGQDSAVEPRLTVRASSLVGVSGDGLATEGLLYGAVTHAKALVGQGQSAAQALMASSQWLTTAVGTLLSDTGRASERLAMMARPVSGYVRMLNPPSCGRCVILAGKRFAVNAGFQRHPGCDCRHIPASESVANDLRVDPQAYFDSLDEKAQARLMGSKANAEAVREFGADMGQIINAYRTAGSVQTAQVMGQTVKLTIEGTTRRGMGYKAMKEAGYVVEMERRNGRYFRLKAPRIMPETIAKIATDRADQERLLRLYGWIL